MAAIAWRMESSVRFYRALLWLYPAAFRARFGAEMVQVFRDCWEEAGGGYGRRPTLWLRTFKDLVVSLPAVWRRELRRVAGVDLPVRRLVDPLVVPTVVVATLLVAGHTWVILTQNMGETPRMPASHGLGNLEPAIAAGIVSGALGALSVLSSWIVARSHRTECLWITRSTAETASTKENV